MCNYYRNQEVILTSFPRNSETTFRLLPSALDFYKLKSVIRCFTSYDVAGSQCSRVIGDNVL